MTGLEVRCEGLVHLYPAPDGSELVALRSVDLDVPAGGRLALLGPSGAGKSTLLQMLARFHDVDAGAVRVGGVDVRAIAPEELMARIAVVFQDVYLFDGTIEEGDVLHMWGSRPPCGRCRGQMREFSEGMGADVRYYGPNNRLWTP